MTIKVGDYVRVLSVDEIGKKLGYKYIGDRRVQVKGIEVYTPISLLDDLCGKKFKVTDVDRLTVDGHGYGWSLSKELVEKCDPPFSKRKKGTREFRVGDVVCIKSWSDMEKEFGLTDGGSIDCAAYFTKGMELLCGKVFTIGKIDSKIGGKNVIRGCGVGHIITEDMIEFYTETESKSKLIKELNLLKGDMAAMSNRIDEILLELEGK